MNFDDILSDIFDDASTTPDQKADNVTLAMVGASATLSIIPAYVNWAFFAGVLGAGVVATGRCYGIKLDEEDAWKLVRQFFLAAGFGFVATAVGAKFLAAILAATGGGYFVSAPIDAAMSAAAAYATGECAKVYFKGERDKKALGKVLRDAFQQKRGK